MAFNAFVDKFIIKNQATSNIKIQQVLSSIGSDNVRIYLRDGPFSGDIRIVNLHPSKGTLWVPYINKKLFDSCGCSPPQKLSKFIIKRNGHCLNSEYKREGLTSKTDKYCSSFCLYILYLTKAIGIEFKTAVLNLNYQRDS